MTIATEIIQNYRLALRGLWNGAFWGDQAFRDEETVRDFERSQPMLFRGLVARRLEPLGETSESVFGKSFRIVPPLENGRISMMFVKSRESADGIWEQLSGPFFPGQLKLTLIDFFDWNIRHWRDFRYYRVKIEAFENKPQLIGGEGLIDVLDADVLWNVND